MQFQTARIVHFWTAIDTLSRNHEEMAQGRIRSGLPLQKRFLSITEAQLKYRLKRSDIEIEFEKERRRIVPAAASRLDCIFVADNEDTIKSNIQRSLRSHCSRSEAYRGLEIYQSGFWMV